MTFKPRDPVIYTDGAGKRELGFIISVDRSAFENTPDVALCRFWHPNSEKAMRARGLLKSRAPISWRLRTTSCSELCSVSDLTPRNYGANGVIRIVCDAMGWAM